MNSIRNAVLCLLVFLLSFRLCAQERFTVQYEFVDKDSSFSTETLGLQYSFANRMSCDQYLASIPSLLKGKGYMTASLDSIAFDSAAARAWIYLGGSYKWANINTSLADKKMLGSIGWKEKLFSNRPLDFTSLGSWQEKMLNYYENNGYPFARIELDSLQIESEKVYANLKTEKGPQYRIDSIRVFGKAKISNYFLRQYLGIENGSIYRKEKLQNISRRLVELPYLREIRPWDITMAGTGSILNLYIDPKKSSQVDLLIGFLPANDQLGGHKLLLTGEANINLKNALGGGETIGANWQQLQPQSPRLNLLFEQPFLFHTPFGINFSFDLLKKDSSYLNLNAQFGLQYLSSGKQNGRIFIQSFITNLLPGGIDTGLIKSSKMLPSFIDAATTNLGVDYRFNNTDYRFNPRKGNEFNIVTSAGIRNIKKSTTITNLTKDASGNDFDFSSLYDTLKLNSYLLKIRWNGAHYFRMGKQSVLKTSVNSGWIQSQNIFRNEIFQIGGYRLLRGFDEESVYATGYAVLTAEFRYLIGLNSYFFGFTDWGWAKNKSYGTDPASNAHNYLGIGMGMAFETKAGIFNLSYAVGKREDSNLSLRQSKIHFGLVSLF
jgi:outer membrane protein assembly factor BamA